MAAVRPPVESVRAARALGDPRAVVDLRFLSRLVGRPPEEFAPVLRELGGFLDLERQIHVTHLAQGRSFYAQFRAPLELYALVRILRPEHIVETGVSSGVSSAHFLLGLRANRRGTLHSIDLPTRQRGPKLEDDESPVCIPPGLDSGWAIPAALRKGWDLRPGRAEALLPRLVRELPRIDLFQHDSHHTPAHLTFELESVRPKLRPGAVVIADNTVWTGQSFERFARRLGAPVVRRRRSDLVALRVPG